MWSILRKTFKCHVVKTQPWQNEQFLGNSHLDSIWICFYNIFLFFWKRLQLLNLLCKSIDWMISIFGQHWHLVG